jgi:phage shock protein PspC (stress-responsive transcriptional regulator)
MNKTININLGGIFFHIDEKAYLKLKHYLDAIANSLNDDPQGKEEIISDIEQRISELLSEKIKDNREVINELHIDEIISIMGQPEEYTYDDELFTEEKTRKTFKSSKKLYRDGKDKILGGVSSGLGYYFGVDTAWVRIIWIIITLFFGTGIVVYLVLWIILPEANSTAEELEMKGEAVNIDNIEKTIKEEYLKLEEKVRNADYTKVKSGFQDLIETLGHIIIGFFKIIGMIIGVLILIIAATTLIGLIIGLFSWGGIEIMGLSEQYVSLPPFFENAMLPIWLLTIMFFLALIIPFIFLFILGLNILSKDKKSLGLTANFSMLGIWILSIIGLIFTGISHSSRFATKASIAKHQEYEIVANDTLSIFMHGNDKLTNRKSLYQSNHLENVVDSLGNEQLYSSNVDLDIRKSNSDKIMVKVIKRARAFNHQKAKDKTEKIIYYYDKDTNVLNLNAYFLVPKEMKNNRPSIDVVVFVPENRYVYLDNSTRAFLDEVKNLDDIRDREMPDHVYLMSSKGFSCTDCQIEIEADDKDEDKDVNLKIDKNGFKLSIDNGKEKVDVKIDEDGVEIK